VGRLSCTTNSCSRRAKADVAAGISGNRDVFVRSDRADGDIATGVDEPLYARRPEQGTKGPRKRRIGVQQTHLLPYRPIDDHADGKAVLPKHS